jgi:hypothetical protein
MTVACCCNCGWPREPDRWGARCWACGAYWRRHGVEHPLPVRRRQQPGAVCVACHESARKLTRARCPRCYTYWHRHGQDRPARLDRLGTPRPCARPGCPIIARRLICQYCPKHYMAWWRKRQREQAA